MSTTSKQPERRYKDESWLRKQLREEGRTQTEIAAKCGVDPATISRWCSRFNLRKPQTATFRMDSDGYEQFYCGAGESADTVLVHRLLATLQVDDLDELDGKHVHHESRVPWDNRPENIEVVSPSEHRQRHTA